MSGTCSDSREEILQSLILNVGQIREAIGNLQGSVQAGQEQRKELIAWMQKLDERLRLVEKKAAVNGMVAGGVVTIILTVFGSFFKIQYGG